MLVSPFKCATAKPDLVLVDEPLVNEHFESIDELEDVLATRCCVLQQMNNALKNLTNYHWFNYR